MASRKLDHLRLCSSAQTQSHLSTKFDDFYLEKSSFPRYPLNTIDTSVDLFGKTLSMPLIIGSMTGGSSDVTTYNKTLARVAEELGIGMGIGSQRRGLESTDEIIIESYRIAREEAPKTLLIGNISAVQLIEYGNILDDLIEMIRGDAIAIHLNFEQELAQPEGDRDGINIEELSSIIKEFHGNVIGKQVGHGMTRKDVLLCKELGMCGVDVAGVGGTSFSGVEYLRSCNGQSEITKEMHIGKTLWDFGVPTAWSVWEASKLDVTVLAGGGIRNGLDIVKALAIGADATSITQPFVSLALNGAENCIEYVNGIKNQIASVMFLHNAKNVEMMKQVPMVVLGETKSYMKQRIKLWEGAKRWF
ncbi:Isopentenyl-diphosphate delta-isomerase [Entamoeba marina]